jgi:DNA primase
VIPDSFIQELLSRIDIVELIDAHVPLRKAGANFAACCPFHSEKTPSFTVSPSKQFYHCFGCGAHGTAIGFLMEYSGLGFVEAVKDLSQRAGLQVPDDGARSAPAAAETNLVAVMAAAARYYREQLKHSQRAIEYLRSRGLSGETAARFGVGYAPDGWQNLQQAFPDYEHVALQTTGLVIRNDAGRLYDRFRDRVMFPILNARGEVIAFGGRVIGPGEPKYLNSPETPLFEKGRELFGLPQARAALREEDTAIVVEGYMDVIALAQHGVGNALATLGTATTPEHARKLFRQVDRVVFCFDGDLAGRKAAWRALENTIDAAGDRKRIAFAFLPEEHDPDSFVRQHGAAAFRAFIDRALPLSEYLVQELTRRSPPDSVEGRVRLLHEAKPLLAKVTSAAFRLQLIKRLAELTGNSPGEVETLCELRPVAAPSVPRRPPRLAPSLARGIARLILRQPALAARMPLELLPSAGSDAELLRTLVALCHESSPPPTTAGLIERLQRRSGTRLLDTLGAELIAHPLDDGACEREFDDALAQLQAGERRTALQGLAARARSGQLSAAEKAEYLALLRETARQPSRAGDS